METIRLNNSRHSDLKHYLTLVIIILQEIFMPRLIGNMVITVGLKRLSMIKMEIKFEELILHATQGK